LLRYFNVSKAKFALLTNGIIYRFYTDLKELNKMDDKPFLELDMTALKESQIIELKKFHKSYFDVNNILNSASELKYMGELKAIIQKELTAPSTELVKLFSKQVYEGMMYQNVLDQFSTLVKKSISSYINDLISDRLKGALAVEEQNTTMQEEAEKKNEEPESKVITTEEELEAYRIVKAICRQRIDITRVVHRDTQTYFGILLDDNNRKPICRMYFNSTNKYVATFDAEKKEVKHILTSLDDIYNFSDDFLKTIELYDSKTE
ncbi:MAG: restriction endonuclease, partial [Phocaeicola sp.]